ncbi:B3/B4 domain-containing protein [Pseudomonas cedrina]|uniref:B3/B4 domain-containing protein n=1 Tax=Pseudomonas cedrina TaxID=651740 RepID=UPI002785D4D7|nr:B3/4 domain-containing protein [Pseudomonas cedrina]MDQ0654436.1 DNA/RNA-binding domain of Phe-tRNA-synthetase-like protein [Pseudomonas cedrina]
MLSVLPLVDPAVAQLAPEFRALSVVVQAAPLTHPEVAQAALARACKAVQAGGPSWGEAHLAAWADTFRKFGAKPQRTPCSAEALRKRVLRDGNLPGLDPIVDLYNAISLEYAVPVGGENIEAYAGSPRLVVARGTEPFDTMKEGAPAFEYPDAGEVVWRDDKGVTCRRWNWRQGVRTRLGADATHMWFILESLPAMPLEALTEAGDKLIEGLQQMMPGVQVESSLIGPGAR